MIVLLSGHINLVRAGTYVHSLNLWVHENAKFGGFLA